MKVNQLLTVILLIKTTCTGAQNIRQDSSVIGKWKGTSICQVKNSPCHDEIVVYHITQVKTSDTFNIAANKMVNGKEEDMGIISCTLDRKNKKLLSSSHNAFWTFNLNGIALDGTLVYKGDLYRIIKLTKQE